MTDAADSHGGVSVVPPLTNVAAKPRLLVDRANPDETVAALRDILAVQGGLYDRGVPVRLAQDQMLGGAIAQVLTPEVLVMLAHSVCRPYELKTNRAGVIIEKDARLPRDMAVMHLNWHGAWNLPPLNGIASSPLLGKDGAIRSGEGYDLASGLWCEKVPDLSRDVPARPTESDAREALQLIRATFSSFCFADADMLVDAQTGIAAVNIKRPPGFDESGFLVGLMTAVCRANLHLAPGLLLRAAPMSGAGAGKGLLARSISMIAFGRQPHAVTSGANAEELEKRIAAELMGGSAVLFLDNLNNRGFRSELLASAITERPARVRLLGRSQMLPLNSSAFVVLTGNGLTVSEDLARRFVSVELDPRTENPEARRFATDIRKVVEIQRVQLLAAALTIWRWGRQHPALPAGRELGSFEQWCQWVRDPLLALGCKDPAERVGEAKERDANRQQIAELFSTWWTRHQDRPLAIRDIDPNVLLLLDPQNRGRQFQSAQLERLTGTRMAGFILTRQSPAGKWGAATYALAMTAEGHRDHRGHRIEPLAPEPSDAPDAPDGLGTLRIDDAAQKIRRGQGCGTLAREDRR